MLIVVRQSALYSLTTHYLDVFSYYYVSYYYYVCVRILLYVSAYYYICVRMLLYLCEQKVDQQTRCSCCQAICSTPTSLCGLKLLVYAAFSY
jgi:hypothetical protein